jgi:hypothetical protein
MQVTKDQDCTVIVLGQWVDSFTFQVHLPYLNIGTALRCMFLGLLKRLWGSVATDYFKLLPGEKNSIPSVATGEIQYWTGQALL